MVENLDIVSEPAVTKEEVTYVEVAFVGGGSVTATIHEGDTYEADKETIRIERNGELVIINTHNVLWVSTRVGVEETPAEQPTQASGKVGDQSDQVPAHLREEGEESPLGFYSGSARPRKSE